MLSSIAATLQACWSSGEAVGRKMYQITPTRITAMLVGLAVILVGVIWYIFRPTASPEDQQAWRVAAMEDSIPAYQLYMREVPEGYFSSRAKGRIDDLKTEADQAFAKAKQVNTPQAYVSFIQTY